MPETTEQLIGTTWRDEDGATCTVEGFEPYGDEGDRLWVNLKYGPFRGRSFVILAEPDPVPQLERKGFRPLESTTE